MRCAFGWFTFQALFFVIGTSITDVGCFDCSGEDEGGGCQDSMPETQVPFRLGVNPRFLNRERQPGLDLLRALAITFNCVTDSLHRIHLPPCGIAAAAHKHARGRLRNRSGRRFGLITTT